MTVEVDATISSMGASGGALATASVAVMPLAPGRLSTMTGWPNAFSRLGWIRRATVSLSPPGANGTTMRTGWSGQVCARACVAAARLASNAVSIVRRNVIMALLPTDRIGGGE